MNSKKITAFLVFFTLLAIVVYWQSSVNIVPIDKIIDNRVVDVPTRQQDIHLDTSIAKYTVQVEPNDTMRETSVQNKEIPIMSDETDEQIQNQTQEVYEALLPDNYEETIQESQEAFESLDTHKQAVDKEMQSFMEIASQPLEEIETDTEEAPEYTIEQMDLPNIDE